MRAHLNEDFATVNVLDDRLDTIKFEGVPEIFQTQNDRSQNISPTQMFLQIKRKK